VNHILIKHYICIILIHPFSRFAEGSHPQFDINELISNTDPEEPDKNSEQAEEGKNYIIFQILSLRKMFFSFSMFFSSVL